MLLAGATIKDGRDGLAGFSSAPAGDNCSKASMPRKANKTRMAIMATRKDDISPKSDTQLV
jgi:hypothetical protein